MPYRFFVELETVVSHTHIEANEIAEDIGTEAAAGAKHHPHWPKKILAPATARPDLSGIDTTDPEYMQEALVPLSSESHGGEDVGVWARGPGSDAVRGSLEQNALYHIIVQATPRLRAALCSKGLCDAHGVPVTLPTLDVVQP